MAELVLPTAEDLGLRTQDIDIELHWMSGPPIATPEWVIESWKRAAAFRQANEHIS